MPQPISNLPIGALVKDVNTKYYNAPIVWKIADKNHEGYPENSVTLISDKIIGLKSFDGKETSNAESGRKTWGSNRYRTSNLRLWLNSVANASAWWTAQNLTDGTLNTNNKDAPPSATNVENGKNPYDTEKGFLQNLSADFKAALLDTTLIVVKNTVTDGGGSEAVTDKIFLPSNTEVGLENENNIAEGFVFPIFTDNNSRLGFYTPELVSAAPYEGEYYTTKSAKFWSLRTPYAATTNTSRKIPSTGVLSNDACFAGQHGIRPVCNISSSVYVSYNPDTDGAYLISFVPAEIANLVFERRVYDETWGNWIQLGVVPEMYFFDTVPNVGTQIQYRAKAIDTSGDESPYVTGVAKMIDYNNPPIVIGGANLGAQTGGFTYTFQVDDPDEEDALSVSAMSDGVQVLYVSEAERCEDYSIEIDNDTFLKAYGCIHTITITVTDGKTSITHDVTWERVINGVDVILGPIGDELNDMPTLLSVGPLSSMPDDAVMIVLACNNCYDDTPVWENISSTVASKNIHMFSNDTKIAGAWGIKIRIQMTRGSMSGSLELRDIGVSFK